VGFFKVSAYSSGDWATSEALETSQKKDGSKKRREPNISKDSPKIAKPTS
jgi:hypothetical protein